MGLRRAFFFLLLTQSAALFAETTEETLALIDSLVQNRVTDKTAISAIAVKLNDPEAPIHVRERVAWAIGQLNLKEESPRLIEAASHKSLLIRSAALNALIHMRAKDAFEVILEAAQSDAIVALRRRATLGLGLLGLESGIKPLATLSSDERADVRGASALAMSALHSKRNDFKSLLTEMTADTDAGVARRAAVALDIAKRNNKKIYSHLTDEDADVRLITAHYFTTHGMRKDLPFIKVAVNQEADEEVRQELMAAEKAIERRAKKASKKTPRPVKSPKPS